MKKFLQKYLIALIFLCIAAFSIIHDREKGKVCFQNEIHSIIIEKKGNSSWGRSYDYITSENVTVTLMNSDTLQIGDSVVKSKNDWNLKLYRKDKKDKYQFVKEYNLNW